MTDTTVIEPAAPEPVVKLSAEEQEALVPAPTEGEDPPSVVYAKLDETGMPQAPADTEMQDPADAFVSLILLPMVTPDMVSTRSGAPVTSRMNPEHTFYDPALAARNPVPGSAQPPVVEEPPA